jgi:hypothetical protein
MRDCRYGLYMGALFLPLIVLSQAVFPSTRSDDEYGAMILCVHLAIFLYYGTAGFLGVRRSGRLRDGIRIGALTALVGIGLILATFVTVDNIFLETVSQQVDKIRGFERSHYASMRAYINWSMLEGAIFALPLSAAIGAALGGVGGLLAPWQEQAEPAEEASKSC